MQNRINRIYERTLQLAYDDFQNFSFKELPVIDNSASINQTNFTNLGTENFKAKQGVSPEIILDLFHLLKKP